MSDIHNLASIDLNQLVVLDELLRTRNTTTAARRLGRTQSAVSHTLARLRTTFRDPLLVRAGPALRPTTLAERLQGPLRELLRGAAAILSGASAGFAPATIERTFVVSCTDLAELVLLPRVMSRLRIEAPGADVVTRFLGDEMERAVQRGDVDLGFGTGFRGLSGVIVERVLDETMVMLLRTGHPALARRLTAKRYTELDHVLVTPRGLPGSSVDAALEPLGLQRRVVLRLPHFLSAAAIVARTDLAVTVPATLAAHLGAEAGLTTIPVPFAMPTFTWGMAYGANLKDDPAHKWLRTLVMGAARAKA